MRRDQLTIGFDIFKYILLALASIICVLPFIVVISGSLSDNATILREGYSLLPQNFSTAAYGTIFRAPKDIVQAYKMTFFYTLMGTFFGLMTITLTAYVISRKEFKYRKHRGFSHLFHQHIRWRHDPLVSYVRQCAGAERIKRWPSGFPRCSVPFLVILMRTFITGSVCPKPSPNRQKSTAPGMW